MPLQRTEAIILKSQKQGETSKILTLFTRHYGLLKVIAKGSRGLKSRFFGTLEPLNHISIIYYFKNTRELQLLSQADIIHSFVHLREDLEKYAIANFCCELIQKTQLENPERKLYLDLLSVLSGLDKSKERSLNFLFWFLLRFLSISGFKPVLNQCRKCGSADRSGNLRFSILHGGWNCEKCQNTDPMSISVRGDVIDFLHKIQLAPIQQVDKLFCPAIGEAETLLLSFLQYHVEEAQYLKSLKFLKNIQSKNLK